MKTINDLKILDFKFDCRKSPTAKTGLIDLCNKIESILGNDITLVEIGTFSGISASIFAQFFKSIITIDPYLSGYDPKDLASDPNQYDLNEVSKESDKVVKQFPNITKIKKTSIIASNSFQVQSVPIVYIDASHTYESVKQDIKTWLPKIKGNNIIAGHDWNPKRFPGVVQAVQEELGKRGNIITFPDTSWLWTKY